MYPHDRGLVLQLARENLFFAGATAKIFGRRPNSLVPGLSGYLREMTIMANAIQAWMSLPVIGSVIAGAVGGYISHFFTRRREQDTARRKRDTDRVFICTELVFLLEVFADDCASVATDTGETQDNGVWHPAEPAPELVYTAIEGNWNALPPDLMYRLRELPVHQREVRRLMGVYFDDCLPPDIPDVVRTRQYRYTQLGLKALGLARRLRRLGGMPVSRRGSYPGSPQSVLLATWHTARHRRDQRARACPTLTRTVPEVP